MQLAVIALSLHSCFHWVIGGYKKAMHVVEPAARTIVSTAATTAVIIAARGATNTADVARVELVMRPTMMPAPPLSGGFLKFLAGVFAWRHS